MELTSQVKQLLCLGFHEDISWDTQLFILGQVHWLNWVILLFILLVLRKKKKDHSTKVARLISHLPQTFLSWSFAISCYKKSCLISDTQDGNWSTI